MTPSANTDVNNKSTNYCAGTYRRLGLHVCRHNPSVIFLIGALGGMMLSGIIGLFVGAVITAISYTLFMSWINEDIGHFEK